MNLEGPRDERGPFLGVPSMEGEDAWFDDGDVKGFANTDARSGKGARPRCGAEAARSRHLVRCKPMGRFRSLLRPYEAASFAYQLTQRESRTRAGRGHRLPTGTLALH